MPYELSIYEFDEERDLKVSPVWASDEVHQVPMFKPMTFIIWLESDTHCMTYGLEQLSFPTCKGWDWRIVDGMGYVTVVPVTDPEAIKQREALFRERLRPFIEDFPREWGKFKAELEGCWEKLDAVDVTGLRNIDLIGHFRELLDVYRRVWEIHFLIMNAAYCPYILFEELAKELVGVDDTSPMWHKLMSGFDNKTFQGDRWLWQLSQRAFELGLADVFLSAKADEIAPKLKESEAGRKWLAELADFLKVFGKRMAQLNNTGRPTWEEDISIPILRVQGFVRKGGTFRLDEEREKAAREREEAEKEILAKIRVDQRDWFEMLLHCAQNSSSLSEEHAWWIEDHRDALLRYCLLEFGRRLVQARTFDEVEDVFYITPGELLKVAYHPELYNLRPLISSRKTLWEEHAKKPHPLLITKMSPEEAFGWLMQSKDPIMVKLVAGALPTPRPELKADLWGTCGAPGVAEGTARVILSDAQLGEIQPGDILVAHTTYVAWTAIFSLLSGVVVNVGGSLSHAAICSREHGIPCILNTFVGTSTIKSGQRVRIDANIGAVYLLD